MISKLRWQYISYSGDMAQSSELNVILASLGIKIVSNTSFRGQYRSIVTDTKIRFRPSPYTSGNISIEGWVGVYVTVTLNSEPKLRWRFKIKKKKCLVVHLR